MPGLSREAKGATLVVISASGFAALAIFAKLAYQAGAASLPILNWRFLISSLLMLIYLGATRQSLRVTPRHLVSLFLLGAIGYGAMSSFFFGSLRYISAAMASMFLYTYPALVAILSFLVWRDPLTRRQVAALALSAIGTTVLLWDPAVSLNITGVLLALGSAVAYSGYLLYNQHLSSQIEPSVSSGYIIFSAAIGFTVLNLCLGSFSWQFSAKAWSAIILMSFFSTALAVTTLIQGIKLVGAATASIISTMEPVVTVALAVIVLGERLSPSQIAGGLLILTGVAVLQWPSQAGASGRSQAPSAQ